MHGPDAAAQIEPRAILLVNTHSRRGAEAFEPARQGLLDRGIELEAAIACDSAAAMRAAAEKAVAAEIPILVGGGGDGTLCGLADLLEGKSTALGVLPLGTGNSFARDLGLEPEIEPACDVVAGRRVAEVDMGRANGDAFLNVATIGLTTRIAGGLKEPLKRRFGKLVYVAAVVRGLREVRPFRVKLETENGRSTFQTLQVVIGNGKYHAGPFPLGPRASLTSGKFRLYALASAKKASLIKLALMLPSGLQGVLSDVHAESAARGTIEASVRRGVTLDGEIRQRTPLRFEVRPRALRVLVPEAFEVEPPATRQSGDSVR